MNNDRSNAERRSSYATLEGGILSGMPTHQSLWRAIDKCGRVQCRVMAGLWMCRHSRHASDACCRPTRTCSQAARAAVMGAKQEPMRMCHCCGVKQRVRGVGYRIIVQKWQLHEEFHRSAFRHCSTAAKDRKAGEFSVKPAAVWSQHCCQSCWRDWEQHLASGGKAALDRELQRLAIEFCARAGIAFHPGGTRPHAPGGH